MTKVDEFVNRHCRTGVHCRGWMLGRHSYTQGSQPFASRQHAMGKRHYSGMPLRMTRAFCVLFMQFRPASESGLGMMDYDGFVQHRRMINIWDPMVLR